MPNITIAEVLTRGSLDIFTMAFDLVKVGADDLKSAISVQKLKASFIEMVKVSEERFNADMERLGCSRNKEGNGWIFSQENPEDVVKSQKRTVAFMNEVLPIEEITVSITKPESLRKIIDSDANIILAGVINIPIE